MFLELWLRTALGKRKAGLKGTSRGSQLEPSQNQRLSWADQAADEVPAVLQSPGHGPGQGCGAISGAGQKLSPSSPSGFISLWLEHDSDHLSCPIPLGTIRSSSTRTFRLEEVGRQTPWKDFPRLVLTAAEVGAGDRDSHGLCCAGHGSTCVYRPVSMEFQRTFVNRHQPCPENHVASFLNVPDALLLPKEFSGS